jgi:hypothetical protein
MKEAALPEWQAAIEVLMLVDEQRGPTMSARIGVMQALNRDHVREFEPSPGPEEAQEGSMKPYLLMAIGLILCATAGVILANMIVAVFPD